MTNIVYYTDKLTEELYAILDDLLFFATDQYQEFIYNQIEEMIGQLDIHEEYRDGLFQSFIWMVIFCIRDTDGLTIYQHYLRKNRQRWENKSVKLREVLSNWLQMNPSFYHVTKAGSRSGRVFIFQDVICNQSSVVYYPNWKSPVPKNGDLISGLLIPLGNDFYITISRLLQVKAGARKETERYVRNYSEQSSKGKLELQDYMTLMKQTYKTPVE